VEIILSVVKLLIKKTRKIQLTREPCRLKPSDSAPILQCDSGTLLTLNSFIFQFLHYELISLVVKAFAVMLSMIAQLVSC
jgi:hypothetical protein